MKSETIPTQNDTKNTTKNATASAPTEPLKLDFVTDLDSVDNAFDAEVAELKKKRDEKKAELKSFAGLTDSFQGVRQKFDALDETARYNFAQTSKVLEILAAFQAYVPKVRKVKKRTRTFTPEQRAKIAEGQKKRWAERNAAKEAAKQG